MVRVSIKEVMKSAENKKREKIKLMSKYIKQAKHEASKFRKTKNPIYLEQAGNKLYNAHIYLLEACFKKEIKSSNDVRKFAHVLGLKDCNFKQLRRDVLAYHRWFYEGVEDNQEMYRMMQDTFKLFTKVRKRYNLY